MIRTGIGYDIHRLEPGNDLILGGVHVESPLGAVGHSDADVLIHAIIDAILGAASAGDIGEHFPPSDPAYKGISSRELLKNVARLVKEKGWQIGNIDAVVILQEPKLSDYKAYMRRNIAADLQADFEAVSVKAKTKEGLDATGGCTAVEAYAVALLNKTDKETLEPPPEDTVWV